MKQTKEELSDVQQTRRIDLIEGFLIATNMHTPEDLKRFLPSWLGRLA